MKIQLAEISSIYTLLYIIAYIGIYGEYRQFTFNMEHNTEFLLRKPQKALFVNTNTTWKGHWNFDIEIKHADEFRGFLWL